MRSTTEFSKAHFPQVSEFEQNLDRLAEVAVRAGLGLAPGQELLMTATLHAIPLARRITEHAYKAGASLVTTLFTDEESTLLRFRYGTDTSFDVAASWLYEGMAQAYRSGAARLAITGSDRCNRRRMWHQRHLAKPPRTFVGLDHPLQDLVAPRSMSLYNLPGPKPHGNLFPGARIWHGMCAKALWTTMRRS